MDTISFVERLKNVLFEYQESSRSTFQVARDLGISCSRLYSLLAGATPTPRFMEKFDAFEKELYVDYGDDDFYGSY